MLFTKLWSREKRAEEEEPAEYPDEVEFKSFVDTYKILSFSLIAALMFPNPDTRRKRIIGIALILVSVTPIAIFFLVDIYFCWMRGDIFEIIRHSTVLGPFLGGFLKMIFMVWKQDSAFGIISEIDRDYALYNKADEKYKGIARMSLKSNLKYTERNWTITVVVTVMSFPCLAAIQTLYEQLTKEDPQRYMIHELNIMWDRDPASRKLSPYFELMNAYLFLCCLLYVGNFLGYDGFFGVATNHACLKIRLYCVALEDAMTHELPQVYSRVVGVIREQNRTFRYMDMIQDCFTMWLGIIFLVTIIQLGNLLYIITAGFGFDLRYMIFIAGVVVHIFLPCHYCTKVKFASADASSDIYCCGWEMVNDQRVRNMMIFMIARAQIKQEFTAFGMLIFDMDLFVSMLQTSYSMYTLLSS